jgi:hypothetical protein
VNAPLDQAHDPHLADSELDLEAPLARRRWPALLVSAPGVQAYAIELIVSEPGTEESWALTSSLA